MTTTITPSSTIGPEDIRVGDFIAVTHSTAEFIFGSCAPEYGEELKTHRVTYLPDEAGEALRVEAACLPFVLVKTMHGGYSTVDLRRHRVARLSRAYGRKAFKAIKKRRTP